MQLDSNHCYTALKARDRRFDGQFFVGVSTTGVYCRPVCPARTPGRDRCTFFAHAALAEADGYRPCLRCRPELAPGKAPIDSREVLARRAAQRIEQGVLDDGNLESLAAELQISSRQLRRVVEAEFGVGPLALAQTRRLLRAKQLLTDTRMPVVDVAFASGFASLRQFNRLFKQRYRLSPTALRERGAADQHDGLLLRLGYRPPLDWSALTGFLTSRGCPRSEQIVDGRYVRIWREGDRQGWIAAKPVRDRPLIEIEIAPSLSGHVAAITSRLRALFDLDTDPRITSASLTKSMRKSTGLRVPGAVDGFEVALRAVLGQQISVKAATTVFGRFVERFGLPVKTPWPRLDRTAPDARRIAMARPQTLIDLGLTRRRAETIRSLANAFLNNKLELNPGADLSLMRQRLLALPGIGPWTTEYIAMRVLRDPDAFPASDLGLIRGAGADNARQLTAMAEAWRPWRAYAAIHIWQQSSGG